MASKPGTAYQREFRPIMLKELLLQCDISQSELASAVSGVVGRKVSKPLVNVCVNRGYLPLKVKGFKAAVEQLLQRNPRAVQWLMQRRAGLVDIWLPLGKDLFRAHLVGHKQRVLNGMVKNITEIESSALQTLEVEMLNPGAMKLFKLFRHPFQNSVNSEKDIFMSGEHRFAEAAMLDTAYNAGFTAIIGEVGSGKSTIREKVVAGLKHEGGITVIEPRNHRISASTGNYSRINAASICDAIILDASGEKPQISTERKVRQVEQLLVRQSHQGIRHVLIIEEAHNLNPVTFKYLKQIYEIKDGFKRLLGIILIGQPELKEILDERRQVNLREVIRRIQTAEIKGIDDELRAYIEFKFKRIGAKIETIITDDGITALQKRLTITDDKDRPLSQAFPGLIENYLVRAMNLAFEFGESKVTAEVIEAI